MLANLQEWNCRIGVIYISSSLLLEWEWHRILPKSISFHTARIQLPEGNADKEHLLEMVQSGKIEEEAMKLAEAEVDVIAFACTIGSLIGGKEWDKEIISRIEKASGGIPATSTAAALLDALETLNAKKLSVVTPYIDELNDFEVTFLEENGYHVLNIKGVGCAKDQDIGRVTPQQFIDLANEVKHAEADCLFISCTNSRTIEVINELEEKWGKPVLSSNQVTLWDALRKANCNDVIEGYGSIFQK